MESYGQVRGTVQPLPNRGGVTFMLYDAMFDAPIACYLHAGQDERLRGLWGRKVIVSGIIVREPSQQRVVAVRQIEQIEVIEAITPGMYRVAKGAIPQEEDTPRPEVIIRGFRDAW